MPGLLCVSVYVLLCFRLSYWLDKFQSASVCLGKSCAWSRGSPRRHMKTHSRTHTNTHTHTDQCLGSPIEIRSLSKGLYPGIPDITERQKICMKRETPYRALSVCVCACAGVFVQTQHHGTLNGNQLLVSLALSLIPTLERVSTAASQPSSIQMNLSPFTSIHTHNPPWNVPRSVV